MKHTLFFTMVLFLMGMSLCSKVSAQCNKVDSYKDNMDVIGAMVLLSDNTKSKQFKKAIPHLHYLLNEVPRIHTSIYIQGTDVLGGLAREEKDLLRKRVYIDSLMTLYDLRIQNCGQEATVLNRKALDAYFFELNTEGKEKWLLDLFDKVFELNGLNVMDGTLVPYMQVVQINKLRVKELKDEDVFKRYNLISSIMEQKIKNNPTLKKQYEGYRQQIENILLSIIDKVDCDFITRTMAPEFHKDPSQTELVKKMFTLMTKGKCTDDPLWLEVGVEYVKINPEFSVLRALAKKYEGLGNGEKANELFKKAIEVAETPEEKSEGHVLLATVELKKGDKAAARQLLYQALRDNPENTHPYEIIGDLYYNSYDDCAETKNYGKDRLVYIAAYEMYKKAGLQAKMLKAKAAFPSGAELHELNWFVGEEKEVGCWINENVILQKRD